VNIEHVIWQELLNVARGLQTVQMAAIKIVSSIPEDLNDVYNDIKDWFIISLSLFITYTVTLVLMTLYF
jgi:uncharacterized membrane protein